MPTSVSRSECASTIRITAPGGAPSAIRRPISLVRNATRCAITLYTPRLASSSASAANPPSSISASFRSATVGALQRRQKVVGVGRRVQGGAAHVGGDADDLRRQLRHAGDQRAADRILAG